VRTMQEALTGHQVRCATPLVAVRVEEKKHGPVGLYKKQVSKLRAMIDSAGPCSMVQLWSESRHEDVARAQTRRYSDRQSPRLLQWEPPVRRIVVFFKRMILIIRLAKNQRLEPSKTTSSASPTAKFVPTDKDRDPCIALHAISTHANGNLPGIPLLKTELYEREAEFTYKVVSVFLEFQTSEQSEEFCQIYRRLKQQWSKEAKEFQKLKAAVGPEFGYSPETPWWYCGTT